MLAIVALLAYPVLGTLASWTGFVEWAIRDEDVKVEISNPAYTIWPGRIHMKFVRIYVNGDTQFTPAATAPPLRMSACTWTCPVCLVPKADAE